MWLIHPVTLHWRKPIFPLPAGIENTFLGRVGTPCLLPPLSVGTTSDLNLYKSCVCCHNLCEFICVSISFVVLGRHCFVASSTPSGSYNEASSDSRYGEQHRDSKLDNVYRALSSKWMSASSLFQQGSWIYGEGGVERL